MSDQLAGLVNHQVRLAARPVGLPKATDWQFTEEPVAAPPEGGVLIKTLALSLDPAMRGWMGSWSWSSGSLRGGAVSMKIAAEKRSRAKRRVQ